MGYIYLIFKGGELIFTTKDWKQALELWYSGYDVQSVLD